VTITSGTVTSTLVVSTDRSTPQQNYTITTAGTGDVTHTATTSLSVTAPPDFSLTVSPTSQTISRNTSGAYDVQASGVNGCFFSGGLSATMSGLPSGASSSW